MINKYFIKKWLNHFFYGKSYPCEMDMVAPDSGVAGRVKAVVSALAIEDMYVSSVTSLI